MPTQIHIGLNLVFLVPGETGGMEVYAREVIPRLAAIDGLRLTAFVNREAAEAGGGAWGGGVEQVVVPVHARNRLEWVRGEQQHLPRLGARAGCDVVHSLASTAPLHGRFRRVTTIHDLNYKIVPEAHFGLRGLGMRALVPAAARRSHRIIVLARSTADDLVQHLGTPRGKIDIVPHGVTAAPIAEPTPEPELRQRLELADRRVLLTLSAKRPHKNLSRLLEAHARLPVEGRPVLVLPGYPTPHEDELRVRAAELGSLGDVRFVRWVDTSDLEGLYAIADVFVFPSLYEGFGLPVLEAMARGVPVATSARGSLAEVAGDAGLVFDPEDVGAIHGAMQRLLTDGAERDRLRAAGRERAAGFSWERTAELTAAVYERAIAESRR
jgi:glycosyltransferase involved in cell wall biosynthesis